MRSILLVSLLVLVAGCQAQAVKPNPETAAAPQAQPDTTAPLQQKFDQLLKSNTQVEQRITLMQEQMIKLNQQVQVLQQRNVQLLQAMQQMQLQQTQKRAASADKPEVEQNLQSREDELTELVSQLELLMEEQRGKSAGNTNYSSSIADGGFKLVSAYTPKGQWVIFKYDELTGLSWIAKDGGWEEINELENIPSSIYQVILRPAVGDIKGYVAARIDRETGQTWWLKGNSWEPFQ